MTFEYLLGKIRGHPSLSQAGPGAGGVREPLPLDRMLAAWLFWVGKGASYDQIDDFSGVAKGSLGSQGRRGSGVLGRVTEALHDLLVKGELDHEVNGGEICFPCSRAAQVRVMQEFWTMACLPGVIGAIDGCLIGTIRRREWLARGYAIVVLL
jgi:hypothetical protein